MNHQDFKKLIRLKIIRHQKISHGVYHNNVLDSPLFQSIFAPLNQYWNVLFTKK